MTTSERRHPGGRSAGILPARAGSPRTGRLEAGAPKLLRSVAVPIVLLLVWEGLSRSGVINPIILPSPSAVVVRWFKYAQSGELPSDAISSLYRVVVGFLIGTGLALPLGLAMGASRAAYGFLNPILQVLRPIPPIAFIPLAILWFGLGNPPAFFLISLGAFFPVLMNTVAGVRSVDAIYIRAARNLGASRGSLFRRIVIPAAMPHIMTGIRVGFGVAFIVVIVAEMIAVNNGLGYRILEAREYFWSDKIVAGMITIGLLGLGIDALLSRLSDYLLRWHRGLEQTR
jgi:NitT/TauT family transport system permease protein